MITPHENRINGGMILRCQCIYNKFLKNSSFHNKASKWLETSLWIVYALRGTERVDRARNILSVLSICVENVFQKNDVQAFVKHTVKSICCSAVVIFIIFPPQSGIVDTSGRVCVFAAEGGWPDSFLNHLSNRAAERLVYHGKRESAGFGEYWISVFPLSTVRNTRLLSDGIRMGKEKKNGRKSVAKSWRAKTFFSFL